MVDYEIDYEIDMIDYMIGLVFAMKWETLGQIGTDLTNLGFGALALIADESGIRMDVYTDRDVMVVYTADYLDERGAKGGAVYSGRQGVCLESEGYPDAINRPEFPLEIYGPGHPFVSYTELRFGLEND